MLAADGRVRVLDFGLSRLHAEAVDEPEASASGRALAVTVTGAGTLLGTPAYMSPEQHLRGETDARSDQFSFFSTLHLPQTPAARKQGQMREIAGVNSPIIYRANPQDPPTRLHGFGENQETGPSGSGGA
ncbi:MAG: hypothetical protein JNL82_24105 [Myxococcales bacterium]|nr:hypothetical protein [Myxococcales bacterium]